MWSRKSGKAGGVRDEVAELGQGHVKGVLSLIVRKADLISHHGRGQESLKQGNSMV